MVVLNECSVITHTGKLFVVLSWEHFYILPRSRHYLMLIHVVIHLLSKEGKKKKRKKESCAILELFTASIFGGNQTQLTAKGWHVSSKGVFAQHFTVSITSQSLKVKCLKGSSSQDELSSYLTVITPDISAVLFLQFLKEGCSLGFTCRSRIS